MDTHRVGIVWPEAVQPGHLAELELFVPPGLELEIEPADSAPRAWPRRHHAGARGRPRPRSGHRPRGPTTRRARRAGRGLRLHHRQLRPRPRRRREPSRQTYATAAGVPATTTSTAAVAALHELGARRVAVLSPHVDALNERLRGYFETSGFVVVNMVGLEPARRDRGHSARRNARPCDLRRRYTRGRGRLHQLHRPANRRHHRRSRTVPSPSPSSPPTRPRCGTSPNSPALQAPPQPADACSPFRPADRDDL